jgi:hypothetical protein
MDGPGLRGLRRSRRFAISLWRRRSRQGTASLAETAVSQLNIPYVLWPLQLRAKLADRLKDPEVLRGAANIAAVATIGDAVGKSLSRQTL